MFFGQNSLFSMARASVFTGTVVSFRWFTVEDAHNFTLLINYTAVNRTWRQLPFIRHVLLMEKIKCFFWISYRTQEAATSHT